MADLTRRGPLCTVLAIFFLFAANSVAASRCRDAAVANLGLTVEEAANICATCMAILPCSQCTSCFEKSKTVLEAAQCSTGPMMVRLLKNDNSQSPSPPPSTPSPPPSTPSPPPSTSGGSSSGGAGGGSGGPYTQIQVGH